MSTAYSGFFIFVALGATTGVHAESPTAPHRPELDLIAATFDAGGERDGAPKEVSGAAQVRGATYIVSDKEIDHFLYRVLPASGPTGRFELKAEIDFTKLEGYAAVLKAIAGVTQLKDKDRRFDLEGLAACPGVVYAVNERVRQVLVIEDMKKIRVAPIDFSAQKDLFHGGAFLTFKRPPGF